MALNERRTHSRYIIIAIFIIFSALITDILLKMSIEDSKRVQARNNLTAISTCIDHNYKVDRNATLSNAMFPCIDDSRIGFTGDAYVMDLQNLQFMLDSSNDVPTGVQYFTKESIGESFKDWQSGAVALYWLTSGKDSLPGQNVWYNYDGNPEWLEWVNYSAGEPPRPYVIVQGAEEDESLSEFKYVRFAILVLALGLSFVLIVYNLHANRLKE